MDVIATTSDARVAIDAAAEEAFSQVFKLKQRIRPALDAPETVPRIPAFSAFGEIYFSVSTNIMSSGGHRWDRRLAAPKSST
jgi:hypothetical protein